MRPENGNQEAKSGDELKQAETVFNYFLTVDDYDTTGLTLAHDALGIKAIEAAEAGKMERIEAIKLILNSCEKALERAKAANDRGTITRFEWLTGIYRDVVRLHESLEAGES